MLILKAFTEAFYHKITGAHLEPVLATLRYLKHETNVWFEIATLLIPDENDSNEEIRRMCQWIKKNLGTDVPLHFTAFHPDWKMMNKLPTPPPTLTRARRIALDEGLLYVYVGNVHDTENDSTYCHQCKKCVIKRDWYNILEYHLTDDGHCKFCHTPCHGVFEGPVGTWGSKCQPVLI